MRERRFCYACYKGDDFIMLGSKKTIAKRIGVSEATIENYAHPYHHKTNPDGFNLYAIGPLEPWEK